MPRTLAQNLDVERERLFVDREAELARLGELLDPGSSLRVVAMSGPGGVGKTELLGAVSRRATSLGVPVVWVDGAEAGASEESIVSALGTSGAQAAAGGALAEVIVGVTLLLILDRFEAMRALEGWLRERFLPALDAGVRVVIAGRTPLSEAWATHPSWRTMLAQLELGGLAPQHAHEYLARRGVPPSRRDEIVHAASGHPLALALFSDVVMRAPERAFDLAGEPDIVQLLLDELVDDVPDEAHRRALWSLALARVTSEELLGAMVGRDDGAAALFEYLRGLSFVRAQARGLEPHPLIRDLLAADVAWRFPRLRQTLIARAATHLRAQAGTQRRGFAAEVFGDIAFLWRDEIPFTAFATDALHISAPRAGDDEALDAMMLRHYGPEALALFHHWRAHGGELVVVREGDGTPVALSLYLALEQIAPEQVALDPAVAGLHAHLEGRVAGVVLQRWGFGRDSGEVPSPATAALIHWEVARFIRANGASEGYTPWSDLAVALALMPPGMLEHVPAADFTLDGRTYHMVASTARGRDVCAWMIDGLFGPLIGDITPPTGELERGAFDHAVRRALKDFHLTERLAKNALLQTPLVAVSVRDGDALAAAEELRAVLLEGCAALRGGRSGRTVSPSAAAGGGRTVSPSAAAGGGRTVSPSAAAGGGRTTLDEETILERTFFAERVKQVRVAIELELPFGSYRRHLASAMARLSDWLWLRATARAPSTRVTK